MRLLIGIFLAAFFFDFHWESQAEIKVPLMLLLRDNFFRLPRDSLVDTLKTLCLFWGDLVDSVVLRMADDSLLVVSVHCDLI